MTMHLFLLTVIGVALIIVCFFVGIMLGAFFGRYRQRRCACSEAKRVGRLIEERKKAERSARNYSPETVNPNNLPVLDPDVAGKR